MNNVNLIGRVATDTKMGNGVASSLLAVKRIYKSKDGQEADFIPLSLFGRQAENFAKMVSKGEQIGIDGQIKTSEYADGNGEKRYGWSVVVSHFYLLGGSSKHEGGKQKVSADNTYKIDKQLDNLDQILDTVKADEQADEPVNEDKQPAKPEAKQSVKQVDDDEPISPLPPLGHSSNRSHISGNDFNEKVLDSQPTVEQLQQEIAKLKSKAVPF